MKQFQEIIERARGLKSESVNKQRRNIVSKMCFRSQEHSNNQSNSLISAEEENAQNRPNFHQSVNSYDDDVIELNDGGSHVKRGEESSISELDEKSIQEQEEEEKRWLKFLPHIKPKDLHSEISESEPDGIANELP